MFSFFFQYQNHDTILPNGFLVAVNLIKKRRDERQKDSFFIYYVIRTEVYLADLLSIHLLILVEFTIPTSKSFCCVRI